MRGESLSTSEDRPAWEGQFRHSDMDLWNESQCREDVHEAERVMRRHVMAAALRAVTSLAQRGLLKYRRCSSPEVVQTASGSQTLISCRENRNKKRQA
jgi:hypothetical protein